MTSEFCTNFPLVWQPGWEWDRKWTRNLLIFLPQYVTGHGDIPPHSHQTDHILAIIVHSTFALMLMILPCTYWEKKFLPNLFSWPFLVMNSCVFSNPNSWMQNPRLQALSLRADSPHHFHVNVVVIFPIKLVLYLNALCSLPCGN